MHDFVAALDGGEDFVPITLDVRAVGMELVLETRCVKDALACGDVLRNGGADADGDDTEIDDDVHWTSGSDPVLVMDDRGADFSISTNALACLSWPVASVTVLREAIINAIAPQDYRAIWPIQINVYDDKLMLCTAAERPRSASNGGAAPECDL